MPRTPTKTESKKCLKCGTEFNRRRFNDRLEDMGRWAKRKYCSKNCNYLRDEGKDKSGFHTKARKFIKQNCESCGSDKKLDVHHIDHNWKNNAPENLKTLCRSCHMKLHWEIRKQLNLSEKQISKPTETQ
jgi:hypothetical protein